MTERYAYEAALNTPSAEIDIRCSELEELGVNPRKLAPEDIAANMHCHLAPDGSMTYLWKGEPMLHVMPEKLVDENGEESVLWRQRDRIR